jgi:hypothetical protein
MKDIDVGPHDHTIGAIAPFTTFNPTYNSELHKIVSFY